MRNILNKNENKFKIDEMDLKIIGILQKYGRTSDSEIARELKVSNDTIKRRRERLEKEGILTVKALLDPKKFGFLFHIHAAISTKPQSNSNSLVDKLMQIRGVYYIATSLGPSHNILIHFRGKSSDDLYEFLEWLRKQDEVQSIDVDTVYNVIKSGYRDIPLDELF